MDNDEHLGKDLSAMKISSKDTDDDVNSSQECAVLPGSQKKLLNQIIDNIFEKNRISDERRRLAEGLRQILEEKLRKHVNFGIRTRIEVFGSLASGLFTNSSDVDFCVRFRLEQRKLPRKVHEKFIRHFKDVLRRAGCSNIEIILDAKVPIAKFEWKPDSTTKMFGDISFYNVLALHNTQLIKKYCEWEPERLPKLAFFMKKWAQTCEIGSSAHGSLSSYAHVIMLIYYLQNVEPPVLPRLQRNFSDNNADELIDGWNVHFSKIVFPNWSANSSSVAELLVGYFHFYASFQFDKDVICIRSSSKFPRQTNFIPSDIMIEDPFDLSRNLGSGVKSDMAAHIKKAFSTTYRVLTVDFPATLSDDLMEENPSSLNSIEDKLLQMCNRGEKAPVRPRRSTICSDRNEKDRLASRSYGSASVNRNRQLPCTARFDQLNLNHPLSMLNKTSLPLNYWLYPPPTIRRHLLVNSVTVPFSPYVSLTMLPSTQQNESLEHSSRSLSRNNVVSESRTNRTAGTERNAKPRRH